LFGPIVYIYVTVVLFIQGKMREQVLGVSAFHLTELLVPAPREKWIHGA